MPPAIEEEEELEYVSSSESAASPQQAAGDDAAVMDLADETKQSSHQPNRDPSPIPVVSDIPLVVSDIPQIVTDTSNGVHAPSPQPQPSTSTEKEARNFGKRKASSEKTIKWTQDIALLAAYEAAIGPAYRAIANVGLAPSEKAKRGPKKKMKTKSAEAKTKSSSTSTSKQATSSGTANGAARPPQPPPPPQRRHEAQQRPAPSVLHQEQGHRQQPATIQGPEVFERMERQALRRRKVEALESLAHTAALLLAEFMDFNRKGSPPDHHHQTPPPPAEAGSATPSGTGGGSAYAAAAAGVAGVAASVFREVGPSVGGDGEWTEREGAVVEERSLGLSDSESSASDSDDDGDIPARIPSQGQGKDDEYDSEESQSEVEGEEPGVKVEDE
ncbi:hypothetical protein VPNG_01059 [Cytospora leucostoma]|uniref:Uncharacterized protein n=1 Tax=Cytospora leucostoma TaxID=1230097 RepID=A0A423XLZ3_9PEZI|nr:hypothetical protein VPNG_01059 [Cytospora leucostoma]